MSMDKNRAWKLLEDISFVRVAGSEEELKAACEEAGVPAVIEDFEVDVVNIHTATLEVLEPEYHAYPVIGIGKTANTPAEGVVGGFKYIEDGVEANLIDVEGKIVLLQGRGDKDLYEKLQKKGALGYIAIAGNIYEDESIKNQLRPTNAFGKEHPIPGVKLHITDAEKLVLSKPTKVKLVLNSEKVKATSHNVVATIQGTEKPDEIVTFSAHYDSVIYGTGAWDNGTGSITILEIMHHFVKNPPKRTLQFIWCGSEEIGLVGSRKFCEDHKEELKKHRFNINVDMTGVLIGYEKAVCCCDDMVAKHIDFLGRIEGFPITTEVDLYASDSTTFARNGVPAMTFARLAPKGGAEIHSRRDIFEVLDPDAFIKTVEFMIKFAEPVINSKVFPVPREISPKLKEKMANVAKMMGEDEPEKKEEKAEEKPAEEKK